MRQTEVFKFIDNANDYLPNHAFVATLPSDITTRDQLLKIIYENLRLPGYFGFNWDALSECLHDLHWINEHRIVIVHEALPFLDDTTLKVYLTILSDTCLYWKSRREHDIEVVFPRVDRKKVLVLNNNHWRPDNDQKGNKFN